MALVLLNPRASYGRARAAWNRVGRLVEERLGRVGVMVVASRSDVDDAVRSALAAGERTFVAAGGDGTVNSVATSLLTSGGAGDAAMGAIGLGSSNDFHKRDRPGERLAGVPVRLDRAGARPQDVIRIDYEDESGSPGTRYAVLNASLGITAAANACFNEAPGPVRLARRLSMDAAIVASVLRTLAYYRDIPCDLWVDDGHEGTVMVSNLGIIKNPHFAGSFCYDAPIEMDDGRLGVNLCERLTPFQSLVTLAALSRRRFTGRPKTRSWVAAGARIEAQTAFALETDGEVSRVRSARFTVMPRALVCCG